MVLLRQAQSASQHTKQLAKSQLDPVVCVGDRGVDGKNIRGPVAESQKRDAGHIMAQMKRVGDDAQGRAKAYRWEQYQQRGTESSPGQISWTRWRGRSDGEDKGTGNMPAAAHAGMDGLAYWSLQVFGGVAESNKEDKDPGNLHRVPAIRSMSARRCNQTAGSSHSSRQQSQQQAARA